MAASVYPVSVPVTSDRCRSKSTGPQGPKPASRSIHRSPRGGVRVAFDPDRAVSTEQVTALLEAARRAPTWGR